jgi:hypothetical protein
MFLLGVFLRKDLLQVEVWVVRGLARGADWVKGLFKVGD